ncbi:MAG: alpha/beta hydrolase [Desulfarculus sp.]|nr:alpha/beta hydrolase [Desulfarculus sp.]
MKGALLMSLFTAGCQGFLESQIFFPQRELEATPASVGLGYENLRIKTSDGLVLHAWLVPHLSARHLVVLCHGNAGNVSHRVDLLRRLHALGVSLLIFDYRGYGQSQGQPSEQGFFLDAEAVMERARELAGRGDLRLVIHGHSLGGIAAAHMASLPPPPRRSQPAGLVLESTFPHLGAIGSAHFPLPLLKLALKSHFDALSRIERVGCPILGLHGDRDDIVPLALGRELFAAAPGPKRFITLKGAGHNDTYLAAEEAYFQAWREFLAEIQ